MKTTLDLDDALHAKAKAEAARLRIPLTRLIEESLRQRLKQNKQAISRPPASTVPSFPLGLKPAYHGISLNQLYDQLEAEKRST